MIDTITSKTVLILGRSYPWVLEPYRYASQAALLDELDEFVIVPAEQRLAELAAGRTVPE